MERSPAANRPRARTLEPMKPLLRSLAPALLALTVALPFGTAVRAEPAPAIDARALRSIDVDATAAWYRDKLGFRVVADRTTVQGRLVVLTRRGALVEIAEADVPAAPRPTDVETTASVMPQPVEVLVSDVDEEIEGLKGRGVLVLADPDDDLDGRFRTAWVRDPDGRTVALKEPLSGRSGHAS